MGTKIVVVQMKQLIRTVIFTVLGILLIGVLIYFFIPKDDNSSAIYNPGTYKSEIILHNNPVTVEVTVSEDEILDIQLLNMGETQEVFYPLFSQSMETLSAAIIENQSLEVEYEKDASMTNEILLKAVDKALEQAEKY